MIKLPTGFNITVVAEVVAAPVVATLTRKPKKIHKPIVRVNGLTPRQVQIKELLLQGVKPVVIATTLGIAEKTVKFHKTNLYKLANVNGIAEYIAKESQRA